MNPPPNPAPDRIDQLIALTERLTQLIAQQAQAFEQRRPQDAAANMEETSRLANAYRQEAQRVRAEPKPFAEASPAARAKLIRATEAFDAVIARQGRSLAAVKTVTEGLVHAIAKEVASQRTSNAPYGPPGAKPRNDLSTALTLNRRA